MANLSKKDDGGAPDKGAPDALDVSALSRDAGRSTYKEVKVEKEFDNDPEPGRLVEQELGKPS